MKIVGIVAEYNPFHKGHAYQLQKVREIYGNDTAVVCVMSGISYSVVSLQCFLNSREPKLLYVVGQIWL